MGGGGVGQGRDSEREIKERGRLTQNETHCSKALTVPNVQPAHGSEIAVKELVKSDGVCADVDFAAALEIHSEQRVRGNGALLHLEGAKGPQPQSRAVAWRPNATYVHCIWCDKLCCRSIHTCTRTCTSQQNNKLFKHAHLH